MWIRLSGLAVVFNGVRASWPITACQGAIDKGGTR